MLKLIFWWIEISPFFGVGYHAQPKDRNGKANEN
jgi:hypothetical protein